MPLQATSGAASYDAFGGGVAVVPAYIEEVFSTYLYTGNNSTQTITNGIDLSTKGGLVWLKARNNAQNNFLSDTVIGRGASRSSNSTLADAAETLGSTGIQSFNSTGFTVNLYSNFGSGSEQAGINNSGNNMVSWTFRKQPKFFDIVTYSGNSTAGREIAHNLGSTPGCIIVKRLNADDKWPVYHRGISDSFLRLNATDANAAANAKYYWGNNTTFIAPTSTVFTVATDSSINQTGGTYVAYLFAHNAGGFGLTGTDNVISCGSYVSNGSRISVTLGWEPQWILIKKATGASNNWTIVDSMRELTANATNASAPLFPNLSDAEMASSSTDGPAANATGFSVPYSSSAFNYPSGETYIYIAIRRGPMKVPTSGTSVFSPIAYVGANGAAQNISAGFPVDMDIIKIRNDASRNPLNHARLMGGVFLSTNATGAQQSYSDNIVSFNNAQNVIGLPVTGGGTNEINGASTSTYIGWAMRRAPSFMDVVCYTGTGVTSNPKHNLTVLPELVICKRRNSTSDWGLVVSSLDTYGASLNSTAAFLNKYVPSGDTATTFNPNEISDASGSSMNVNGATYVAYLFATCAGVSKVGSYTGNGSTQTIDCGFTGGARFVIIKRTDSAGGWYVYDTARGMTTLTDPYLLMNTDDVEVATLGSVTTVSTGFALDSTILAAINVSAGTYIFLAIA